MPSPLDEKQIVIGDPAAGQPANQTNVGAFGFWDLLRMLLVLVLVVAAIYGIFFLIRRGRKQIAPESDLIRVLGTTGIAGNRWLHVVAVGKHVYLIGNGDQVNLIAEIEDQESLDEIRLQASQESEAPPKTFADLLGGLFQPSGDQKKSPLNFIRDQSKRLQKMRDKSKKGGGQ